MSAAAEPSLSAPTPTEAADFRASLQRFGFGGVAALIVVLLGIAVTAPIGAVFVLLWAWLSRTPLRDLGLVRPRSWATGLIVGITFGVGLKLLLKAIALPLLGADPINHAARQIIGTTPLEIGIFLAYAILGAGFSEELCYRGFFFERSGKLLGRSVAANILTLLVSSTVFALAHFQQGKWGIVNALLTGLAFGTVYLLNGRRLYTLMIAHASFDLFAAAIVLLNLEPTVAHLVFK